VRVKICGITRVEDALFAENAGADAIGVVMFSPTSRRSVPEPRAREIFDALGPFVTRVVVTHTESNDNLKKILALRPDAIQISHPFTFREDPGVKVIRVIGRGDLLPDNCDAIIVDDSHGKGRAYDPSYARDAVKRSTIPVILAGGLTPENVGEAVRQVQPYAVDVASGVETSPGIKNHEKIQAFVAACRRQ